jgi:hypothetical protein
VQVGSYFGEEDIRWLEDPPPQRRRGYFGKTKAMVMIKSKLQPLGRSAGAPRCKCSQEGLRTTQRRYPASGEEFAKASPRQVGARRQPSTPDVTIEGDGARRSLATRCEDQRRATIKSWTLPSGQRLPTTKITVNVTAKRWLPGGHSHRPSANSRVPHGTDPREAKEVGSFRRRQQLVHESGAPPVQLWRRHG